MSTVYQSLIRQLDTPVRATIQRRAEAMMRQIVYLQETEQERLVFLLRAGWTLDRLAVLCSINSFYQIVIGPLASSGRSDSRTGLGERIPIQYGEEIKFDGKRAADMRRLHTAFTTLVHSMNIPLRLLYANHADDLIFELSRSEDAFPLG